MAKSGALLLTACIGIALTANQINHASAFQTSLSARSSHVSRIPATEFRNGRAITSKTTIRMMGSGQYSERPTPLQHPSNKSSLFKSSVAKKGLLLTRAIQKLRRTVTIALASFAFLLASTRVHPPQIAHASSSAHAIVATSSTTLSLTQKLNPFRTRSVDELIDNYVRDRLFSDDQYDPVESTYREVMADAQVGAEGDAAGAYPTLLAETAGAALGRKDVSSLVSPRSTRDMGGAMGSLEGGKGDGITAALIRTSDFLQRRMGVSASISYYIIAASSIVGLCVVPTTIGVLYQGIQRMGIDKSEMKMYGKISDMDATFKKKSDMDDDDDDEEEGGGDGDGKDEEEEEEEEDDDEE